jgi:hypothetical protein
MTNPTPSEFDAKLKDGIALTYMAGFISDLNPDQWGMADSATKP